MSVVLKILGSWSFLLGMLPVVLENSVEPRPGDLPAIVQQNFQDPMKFMLELA